MKKNALHKRKTFIKHNKLVINKLNYNKQRNIVTQLSRLAKRDCNLGELGKNLTIKGPDQKEKRDQT